MAISLNQLPDELLMAIIDHVQDRRALYRFMQCTRRTFSLIEAYMYRNVVIQHPESHMTDERLDCTFFQSIHDFTVQILREPQRASLTKSLVVALYPTNCAYSSLEAVDYAIEQFVQHSRCTAKEKVSWIFDIKRPSMDALLAVLLPSLPRLERLEFKVPFRLTHCTRMLTNIMEQEAVASERPLQRLRHIGGRGPRTWFWADLYKQQLAYFLQMPCMESIAARIYTPLGPDRLAGRGVRIIPSWDLSTLEPGSSGVTSLELQSFDYEVEGISCAIAACRNLKRLKIKICPESVDVISFAGLTAAVTQASRSLETLSLAVERRDEEVDCYWSGNATVSSLHDRQCRITTRDFPKLRNLTLNVLSIFGPCLVQERMLSWSGSRRRALPELSDEISDLLPQCLPPQIERLHLIVWELEDDTPLIRGVKALFQSVQIGQLDRLAHLRVDYSQYMAEQRATEDSLYRPEIDHMKDINLLAKNVGIHFESNLI